MERFGTLLDEVRESMKKWLPIPALALSAATVMIPTAIQADGERAVPIAGRVLNFFKTLAAPTDRIVSVKQAPTDDG